MPASKPQLPMHCCYRVFEPLNPQERLDLLRRYAEETKAPFVGKIDNVLDVRMFAEDMDLDWVWNCRGEWTDEGMDRMQAHTERRTVSKFMDLWYGIDPRENHDGYDLYEFPGHPGPDDTNVWDSVELRELFTDHEDPIIREAYEVLKGWVEIAWLEGAAMSMLKATEAGPYRYNMFERAGLDWELVWYDGTYGHELGYRFNPVKPKQGRRSWKEAARCLLDANEDNSPPGEVLAMYGSYRQYVIDEVGLFQYEVRQQGTDWYDWYCFHINQYEDGDI